MQGWEWVGAVHKTQKKVCFRLTRESEIPSTEFRMWLFWCRCSACMEDTKRALCPKCVVSCVRIGIGSVIVTFHVQLRSLNSICVLI